MPLIVIMLFIFGLIVGSFLNVCIYRVPKGESIITPRSHCPYCNKTIPWYDNIPLVSYVMLKGKCRFCKVRISPIYFTVELVTGLLFAAFYNYFGASLFFVVYTALACALIVVTFIDFKIEEIPDEITLPGMAIGLVLCFIFPELIRTSSHLKALFYSFLGLMAGGGSIYAMGAVGKFLFRKEAMGGGDVKLLAMIGAFLGWKSVLLIFFLAPFFGSVVGVARKIKTKKDMIPYGPYLSLATIIVILWGQKILGYLIIS